MKKSLIAAVKKLLGKLGAEEIEGNNLVEVIDSGADAIEGGGSGSGGNNNIEYVTITGVRNGPSVTWTADKTYQEIDALSYSGKTMYLKLAGERHDEVSIGRLQKITSITGMPFVAPFVYDAYDLRIKFQNWAINTDNTITIKTYYITGTETY